MAKTLLTITQEILGEMGGDDVSSITDTEESEQVARHVIAVYDNLVSKENWPWMRRPIQLVASGDNTLPNYMTLPSNVKELISVRYDIRDSGATQKLYRDVHFKHPDDFLRYINGRNNTDSNVDIITDSSGIELFIRTDTHPTYFTSFDDTTLIFDSYDSAIDTTLQANKTQALAYILLTLSLADDSTPDLPPDVERLLIEESIARAQWKEREFQDIESINAATSQRRTMSRKAWRAGKPTRYPNYGRCSARTHEPTFKQDKY